MAGEGLEQLDVGFDERADVAEAFPDHEQSERPILARVAAPTIASSSPRDRRNASKAFGRAALREQHRRARGGDRSEGRGIRRSESLLRMHEQLALRTAHAPQRPVAVGGRKKEDLGVLGAEQPARGDEELSDGEPELRRALGRAHRLVEELDVLSLLALFHVSAEGGDAGENRDDEQDDRERASLEQLDDGEAERRRRERSDRRGEEGPERAAAPGTAPRRSRSPRRRAGCRARARPRRRRGRAPRCAVPRSPGAASERKMMSAIPLQSGSSARLNANLTSWRWLFQRVTIRATRVPTSCPISRAAGAPSNRPSVSPISVSESVCACLRNWRWTTKTSAK